jgi:hypothetical protein
MSPGGKPSMGKGRDHEVWILDETWEWIGRVAVGSSANGVASEVVRRCIDHARELYAADPVEFQRAIMWPGETPPSQRPS